MRRRPGPNWFWIGNKWSGFRYRTVRASLGGKDILLGIRNAEVVDARNLVLPPLNGRLDYLIEL